MTKWILIVTLLVLALIVYILDREIWFHEGARLGPRIQGWLYNRWACQYDTNKADSQTRDAEFLACPVLDEMHRRNMHQAFMLDVATGTGRVPLAMLAQPDFHGRIIANCQHHLDQCNHILMAFNTT